METTVKQIEDIKECLNQKIAENDQKIMAIADAIKGLETIKHHKSMTKKADTVASGEFASARLDIQSGHFTSYFRLYLKNRIYKTVKEQDYDKPVYFSDPEIIVYIDKPNTDGYQGIINDLKAKAERLQVFTSELAKEFPIIADAIETTERLEKELKEFKDGLSWVLIEAIKSKTFNRLFN